MATNGNTSSKFGTVQGAVATWHPFKTRWLSKSVIPKLWRSKRALLVVLFLASSAVALTTLGVQWAIKPTPSLASGAVAANPTSVSSATSGGAGTPATADVPLTKLREYVYAGGRLVTSEEKSCVPTLNPAGASSPQGGGTGSFNVSNPSGCSWVSTSNA